MKRGIDHAQPNRGKQHGHGGLSEDHLGAEFIGPFGRNLQDFEAGAFQRVKEVDVESHVSDPE